MTDINDTMNQAIRQAAGVEPPARAAAADVSPEETPDKSIRALAALRDELVAVGGDGLAVAQKALDEAQLADAVGLACAASGVPAAHIGDVRALLDTATVERNLGGQPSAASVARQVAKLVERLPGLADEPRPTKPSASFDGGARTSGPVPHDRGQEILDAVRDVVDRRRGRL